MIVGIIVKQKIGAAKNQILMHSRREKKRLWSGASVAVLILASAQISYANEWIGSAGDNDYFNPANWSGGITPVMGEATYLNDGSAYGYVDLADSGFDSVVLVDGVGSQIGQSGSLTIDVKTDPQIYSNSIFFNTSSNQLAVGDNGGNGELTITTDGPLTIYLSVSDLSVGKGTDSKGLVNLISTGKDSNTTHTEPEISYCMSCASTAMLMNVDVFIGRDGGNGTVNLDGFALDFQQRKEFIIGTGSGSTGTLNVLAGGKIGDTSESLPDTNTLTKSPTEN